MIRRPPTSTRPDTRFPYATLFRSAVIAAGGLSRQADGNGATVLRRSEVGYQEIPVRLVDLVRDGDSTANIPLLPGDVIIIPEGFFQGRSEEHTSEFQSLMRISYAVFCLKKKKIRIH